ncbi:hypothetical protein HQO24_04370 [Rhodococcus fascians]|nr:hypothetical protein [Rhodococcus fascians]MBY4395542.1 hypothetical protein [Rhodococcus fascians]MBY4405016.1 hypothetical protein [Rhodococcus fascians]MBY4420300.1 hypothetical protein [Rhodococcus fascians]MBY4459313.1 hypothetical protein [Rhodococcus fascians]
MNIADQFPELRGRELPSWLGQDIDDDVDLVASARKALAESLRGLDLAASLPGLIDLRFSSATVLEGGSLSADMSGLVKKFQAELQAAMPAALVESGLGDLSISGISEGSVVVHLRPRVAGPADQSLTPHLQPEAFEEALNKILSLHDDFEHGDAWGHLLEQPDALLDSVRKFVLALDEFHADVEVDAFATNGDRLHSSLTKRGRADAIKFFAHREKLVDDQIIAGNVRGLSDAGWIEVASQGTRGKRRIKDVPSDLLDSGQLAFGRYVRIKVSEQTAPQKKTIYRFKELLTPDDIGSD